MYNHQASVAKKADLSHEDTEALLINF